MTISCGYISEVAILVRFDQKKNISLSRRDVVEIISEPLENSFKTIKLHYSLFHTKITNETIGNYQFNNIALSGPTRFDSVIYSKSFYQTIQPTKHISFLIPSSFLRPQGAEVLSLKNESKSSSSSSSIFASATAGPG